MRNEFSIRKTSKIYALQLATILLIKVYYLILDDSEYNTLIQLELFLLPKLFLKVSSKEKDITRISIQFSIRFIKKFLDFKHS